MTRLKWGEDSQRIYETGVDRGVLYPNNGPGVVWNGLISIVDATSDSEETRRYIDGIKLPSQRSSGSFSATLEAFTYPDEFSVYDGISDVIVSQQRRKAFGLSYRTKIGNDVDGPDHGYKIHLVYNGFANPTERDYTSNGESEEALLFSWEITTIPISIPGAKVSAHLIIDTTKAHSWTVVELEKIIYGTDIIEPSLPSPNVIIDLFEFNAILMVIDHGDGTFTVTGPDEVIQMLDATTFQISWPSAVFIDGTSYMISSL